jgi:hypothetical protein
MKLKKHVKKIVLGDVFIWCFSFFYVITSINLLYSSYLETKIFSQIAFSAIQGKKNENEKFISIIHKVHEIMEARQKVFENMNYSNAFRILTSADVHLQTVSGACGSYAIVLARTFQAMGYDVRLPQMYINDYPAGHILVEVKINNNWAVADAMYKQYFITPQNNLASFHDVSTNWEYYSEQTVINYPKEYQFTRARYTNWGKIPVFGQIAKKCLTALLGDKKVSTFSIRPYFLDQYFGAFIILTFFSVPFFLLLLRKRRNFRRFTLSIEVNENEEAQEPVVIKN